MNRKLVTVLGVGAALIVAAVVDLVVLGSLSIFPVGALLASFALVLGAKWLGAHVLSRPPGSRPGELGNPADDLVEEGRVDENRADEDRADEREDSGA